MEKNSRERFGIYGGMDLGDKKSHVVLLEGEYGDVVEEAKIATTQAGVERFFGGRERMLVVIEVGTHSGWVEEVLLSLGHAVLVAEAQAAGRLLKGRKRDRADAETLARHGRSDPKLLRPIHQRSQEGREALAVIRSRDAVVKARTELINHVRGIVKTVGYRLPSWSAESFARKATPMIPQGLRPALMSILEVIERMSEEIKVFERRLAQMAKEQFPVAERLQEIGGVGLLTSLAYVLVIEDPGRFERSRTVGPYLGLTPGLHSSGESNPQLRISKAGDELLRRLLVSASHYILGRFGPDSDLRRFGLRLAGRGGKWAKHRAVVAVARKLAVIMHRLWVSGEAYDPLYLEHRRQQSVAA